MEPVGAYPETLLEFEQRFATEEACREFIRALRWPQGFRCPRCGHAAAWPTRRSLLQCTACEHAVSLTAGTIFEGTRRPLRLWFRAMWLVTSEKHGISALGLQRQLGLGSYQTAWAGLHKIRKAMVRPGRERLSGKIEADETYVGGVEPGVRGRETETKSIVAIAAEVDGKGIGRIRLQRLPDVTGDSLLGFLEQAVEPGSVIHTDAWGGYSTPALAAKGYRHKVTNLSRTTRLAHELLPRVHRVAALLKRWIAGTHQGSVSADHLDSYLDKFTFRFNRRTSRPRGMLFYRLAQQAVVVPTAPYRTLVRP